jgi:thiosulfate reductase cytochrome b subunit
MATEGTALRRGLPRISGGEPWPPAGAAPVATVERTPDPSQGTDAGAVASVVAGSAQAARTDAGAAARGQAAVPQPAAAAARAARLRRGLPRTPGGEPWPPAGPLPPLDATASQAEPSTVLPAEPPSAPKAVRADAVAPSPAPEAPAVAPGAAPTDGARLRRGLPRTPGGEPWPPAATALARQAQESAAPAEAVPPVAAPVPGAASEQPSIPALATPDAAVEVTAPRGPRPPLTAPRTVWPGRAATHRPPARPEPRRIGPFTRGQWAGAVVVGGAALLVAAALAVTLVRFLLSLDGMRDFVAAYPGEYHLPEGAPVGIPAWLNWQHFLNVFLMVFIIKTGLQVRREKRPTIFWAPRRDKKGRISLALWFHQSVDVLWLANGVVFVILLFATGQWMRVIPTSWEVFPNAVSAILQYISLDWPTENGWVNYNAVQQLSYFTVIFLAAPLAALSGWRMSGVWPKGNQTLSRIVPVEWARRVHFPTMLFFVAFIAVHVFLVLATGALRNLNHMYAAQGSTDPVAYADNWTGFWWFAASMVVIVGAVAAARPMVLAPIARLFGTVSGR